MGIQEPAVFGFSPMGKAALRTLILADPEEKLKLIWSRDAKENISTILDLNAPDQVVLEGFPNSPESYVAGNTSSELIPTQYRYAFNDGSLPPLIDPDLDHQITDG